MPNKNSCWRQNELKAEENHKLRVKKGKSKGDIKSSICSRLYNNAWIIFCWEWSIDSNSKAEAKGSGKEILGRDKPDVHKAKPMKQWWLSFY